MDQEWAEIGAVTVAALIQGSSSIMDEGTVARAAAEDPEYELLISKIQSGDLHPHKVKEKPYRRPCYAVRERLAVNEDLGNYTFGEGSVRLVTSAFLRHRVVSSHHRCLDSMPRRARHSMYWPGMEGDLQHHRNLYQDYEKHTPSMSPEGLTITPPPDYPFQQVVADILQLEGNTYLPYADRLTGWLERAPSQTKPVLVRSCHLRQFFTRWGAPEQISTDGGTNLTGARWPLF